MDHHLLLVTSLPNCQSFLLEEISWKHLYLSGCRGRLRSADGTVPSPRFDFVIARLEKKQFCDASGMLKTPAKPSAAHYHFHLTCIRACDPSFLPSSLIIPHDVAGLLCPLHRQHLQLEFGVQV